MSVQPRKRFGQHWLRSEQTLDCIIAAAELTKSDRVLEIGPGTGILTRRLLKEVESVVAVEIDRDLCKKLVRSLGKEENFLLLQGDVLTLDLESYLSNFPRFQNPNKVVANIPYNITGPILEKLLGTIARPAQNPYKLMVLLMQKEVGDRLAAQPGTKAFGALSIRVQYLATCELICQVPKTAFVPPPQVDSVVVRLRPQAIETPAADPRQLDTLIKLGFASRRKMLRNNLKGIMEIDRLTQLLEQLNINLESRAEDLSLHQWIALSDSLSANDCQL